MGMITELAQMLGLSTEHAEAAMQSERAARAVLTRRNLLVAGAALATGAAFSIPKPLNGFWVQNDETLPLPSWDEIKVRIGAMPLLGIASFTYSLDEGRSWSTPQPARGHRPVGGSVISFAAGEYREGERYSLAIDRMEGVVTP